MSGFLARLFGHKCDCHARPHTHHKGPQPAAEDWWSPRSVPDAASLQLGGIASAHWRTLFVGAQQCPNTGFQGPYRQFFGGDYSAQQAGLVRANNRTAKAVPPDQTTLIAGRPLTTE